MDIDSVVLQALDGTQTELQLDAAGNTNPVLLNSTVCSNAVLKVSEVKVKSRSKTQRFTGVGYLARFWILDIIYISKR